MRKKFITILNFSLKLIRIFSIIYLFSIAFFIIKNFKNIDLKIFFIILFSTIYTIIYYIVTTNILSIIVSSEKKPFVIENVKKLDNIGLSLIIVALMNFIRNHSNVIRLDITKTDSVGFILICGMVCFVISDLISRAIEIENDNNLTI